MLLWIGRTSIIKDVGEERQDTRALLSRNFLLMPTRSGEHSNGHSEVVRKQLLFACQHSCSLCSASPLRYSQLAPYRKHSPPHVFCALVAAFTLCYGLRQSQPWISLRCCSRAMAVKFFKVAISSRVIWLVDPYSLSVTI